MDFRFDIIYDYAPLLLRGTLLTIGLSLSSILIGSILGLGVSFGKMSKRWYYRWPMNGYINFFRGTPLLVQILIVHFGLVPLFYGQTNAVLAAITALSLNSAAYRTKLPIP